MVNKYSVPEEQWVRWNDSAQSVFNEVYFTMTHKNQQRLFRHPEASEIPHDQWTTTAFNVAWIAADAAQAVL